MVVVTRRTGGSAIFAGTLVGAMIGDPNLPARLTAIHVFLEIYLLTLI